MPWQMLGAFLLLHTLIAMNAQDLNVYCAAACVQEPTPFRTILQGGAINGKASADAFSHSTQPELYNQ